MRPLERILWKVIDQLAVKTSGTSHGSRLEADPIHDATPVWIHGSARTGTTTSMKIMARYLDRDFFFEPLHRAYGIQAGDPSLEGLVRPFLSSPDQLGPEYLPEGGGSAGCIDSLVLEEDRMRLRGTFESLVDHLYSTYGRGLVFKEIRLFGNLESLARYHEDRGIPWRFLGISASPLLPLYSYYRRGMLCARPPVPVIRSMEPWRYRRETLRCMDLFPELADIDPETPADRFALICLIDQALLERFVSAAPSGRDLVSLAELEGYLHELGKELPGSHSAVREPLDRIRPRTSIDPLFKADVVDRLHPSIRGIIEEKWGETPVSDRGSITGRQRIVSLRHRFWK